MVHVPTSPLYLMWIKTNRSLIRIKDPSLIDVSSLSTYKSRNKQGDISKIRTQQHEQYIQLNTGVKEIQQLNPKALTLSYIDKFLSQNRHRVLGPWPKRDLSPTLNLDIKS